jgi:hypothetical protein
MCSGWEEAHNLIWMGFATFWEEIPWQLLLMNGQVLRSDKIAQVRD